MNNLLNYFLSTVICFSLLSGTVAGQTNESQKPRLIIGIVVDQMRYEYIARFWDNFSENGFKKLINEGSFCTNTETGYFINQSSTGHASISTGAYPSTHGIISDKWYDRLGKNLINCCDDQNTITYGSENGNGRKSPLNLLSGTIGDEMKIFNKRSRIIGISLNDHSAIMLSGHQANAAYWYDSDSGNWISSSFYIDQIPNWVETFNSKKIADSYLNREWNLLLPKSIYFDSGPDNNPFEVGFGRRVNSFPYNLKRLRKKSYVSEYVLLKSCPFGNTLTTDFALSAIYEEQLGLDNITDLLMISFSSIDYIGHLFGPYSYEMEDAMLRLDLEIAHLLEEAENAIGLENILVFLTSNHGVAPIPKQMLTGKMNAGIFRYRNAVALLKSYLNAIYGQENWIEYYNEKQLYLNRTLIEERKIDLAEIQNKAALFLVEFDGVANVLTSSVLMSTNFSHGVFNKMQNSYNQKLSGDLIINLQPGWTEESDMSTSHNSAYEYDSHVPLIWYGWNIPHKVIKREIQIIDIVPTLTDILNIQKPNSCSGKPIYEILK